ncbi:related to RNA-3`-phosphate cyclase 1 [Cephalotrichum gorgonifer]|uniref:Related to RNA-3`-phosphate cyclase 1 n=1 Tax=Cephalotrichum gorgonifer TaxID=2041049 RepID=A0AAE8SSV8_9PEZI|nr:related to RNA-3`-phosphate cyclase 1 [Cephalotrichum gorgonifer]
MAPTKPLLLDGSTGEGGGQLVRLAVALSAVTGQPIRIVNIRANRTRSRPVGKRGSVHVTGGGLKNQHVAAIKCLADATRAETTGLSAGSATLTFTPTLPPSRLPRRPLKIVPESDASSAMLIFQAVLPFLLFADVEEGQGVEVEIHGGTNTSWSLNYEYMDLVLLPTLEARFGVRVERELRRRGWSQGPAASGCVWVKVYPVRKGESITPLQLPIPLGKERDTRGPRDHFEVESVDVALVVPLRLLEPLQTALARDIAGVFPSAPEIDFRVVEDSGHQARIYVLLVAKSPTGLRWGRDVLHSPPKGSSANPTSMADALSRLAVKQLVEEVDSRGAVDVYLQDQLVCFQALAAGRSSFARHGDGRGGGVDVDGVAGAPGPTPDIEGDGLRREKTHEPFGHGSMHTKTARWVAAQLLPGVQFFNKGDVVEGAGIRFA